MSTFNFNTENQHTFDSNSEWDSGARNKDYGDSSIGIHDVAEISADMGVGKSADLQTMERTLSRINRAKYAWTMQNVHGGFVNNNSVIFDGVNECGNTAVDLSGATKVTLSAWMYRANATDRMDIAQSNTDNVERFKMIRNSDGKIYGVFLGSTGAFVDSSTGWLNVIMVFDGTQTGNAARLKIYLAGVSQTLVFGGTIPAVLGTMTNNFKLALDDGSSQYGTGNLNQVALWNGTALTAAEALELYNSGNPMSLENHSQWSTLSHWWQLNTADDFPTMVDSKGASDCTLVNMEVGDVVANIPGSSDHEIYSAGNTARVLSVPTTFTIDQSPVNTAGGVLIPDAVAIKGDGTNRATSPWDAAIRDNFVIEMRIKPDNLSLLRGLCGTTWGTANKCVFFGMRPTSGFNKLYALVSTDGTGNSAPIVSTTRVVSGTWYFVRLVYNVTDGFVLSVNGVAEDSIAHQGQLFDANCNISLFGITGGHSAVTPFDGEIADFRFYSTTCKNGNHTVPATIYKFDGYAKHAWNCEELSGTSAEDIGHTKTNGTIGANITLGVCGPFVDSKAFRGSGAADSTSADVVIIPHDAAMSSSSWTWRCRLKFTAADIASSVFSRIIDCWDGLTPAFTLIIQSGKIQYFLNDGSSFAYGESDLLIADIWYEIQINHNGVSGNLSVDGEFFANVVKGVQSVSLPVWLLGSQLSGKGSIFGDMADVRFYTEALPVNYDVNLGYYDKPAIQYQYALSTNQSDPSPAWNGTWLDDFESEANGNDQYLFLKTRLQKQDVLLTDTSIDNFTSDVTPPAVPTVSEIVDTGTLTLGFRGDWDEPTDPDFNHVATEVEINSAGWLLFNERTTLNNAYASMKFNKSKAGTEAEAEGWRYEQHISIMGSLSAGDQVHFRAHSLDDLGNNSAWSTSAILTIGAGSAPAVPVLAVADKSDGTGATATISASSAGSLNTVYYKSFSASAWTSGGSRLEDGTINISITEMGLYWFCCVSTIGADNSISLPTYALLTDGNESVTEQILVAVRDVINSSGLLDSEGDIVPAVVEIPPLFDKVNDSVIKVFPDNDEVDPDHSTINTARYRINIVLCERAKLSAAQYGDLLIREQIQDLFVGQRLTGLPMLYCTEAVSSIAFDYESLKDKFNWISPVTIEFQANRAKL